VAGKIFDVPVKLGCLKMGAANSLALGFGKDEPANDLYGTALLVTAGGVTLERPEHWS
jgi:hypothetical protein